MRKIAPIIMVVALVGLSACRTATIRNVSSAPLAAPPGAQLTTQDVSRAIHTAGTELGWVIQEVRPGEMTGTLTLRKHVAVVAIRYDTATLSIDYKDSQGLMHNGDQIHRNYNLWIANLVKHIQTEVARQRPG